jgi:phasin family protein
MSQKPKVAMKSADADPRPVAEPADAIVESVNTAAGADAQLMAVTADAGSETATTVSTEVPLMPVAESVGTLPEGVAAASEAAVEPMAVTAEAVGEIATAAAETITMISPGLATAPAAIETTKSATQPGISNANNVETFVAFSQGNLEAFVKSGQIWSAGILDLTQQIAATAKSLFDDSVSTFRALNTVRSLNDAVGLQTRFTKTAIETAMAGTKRITDTSIKLTEQTLVPITDRVSLAVRTFKKAA